jgi:hypothetical protein
MVFPAILHFVARSSNSQSKLIGAKPSLPLAARKRQTNTSEHVVTRCREH